MSSDTPTPRHRKRSRGLTNPCPIARQKRGSAGHALVLPVPRPGSNEYRFARGPRAVKAAAPNTHPAAPSPRAPLRRVPSDSQLYTVLTSGMRFSAFLSRDSQGTLAFEREDPDTDLPQPRPVPRRPPPPGGPIPGAAGDPRPHPRRSVSLRIRTASLPFYVTTVREPRLLLSGLGPAPGLWSPSRLWTPSALLPVFTPGKDLSPWPASDVRGWGERADGETERKRAGSLTLGSEFSRDRGK